MKKNVCVMVLALVFTNIAWGVDFSMSAGGGAFVGGHFTRYTLTANGEMDDTSKNPPVKVPLEVFSKQDVDQFNIGAFLFFDATWVELSVSLLSGTYQYKQTMYAKSGGELQMGNENPLSGKGWETMLGIGLLGKYPFVLNERISVFPLLGVDYQIALRELRQQDGFAAIYDRADGKTEMLDSGGNPYKLSAWNALFIVAGGGADYYFPGLPFFLRGELLYSIRLPTSWESDSLITLRQSVNAPDPKLGGLSSGPSLKLAAGWRLN